MKHTAIRMTPILVGILSILITTPAAAMGGMGGGGGCMMDCGDGTTVIDPPPGAPFADPVTATNVSTEPGVVEVNLEAKISPVNINGVTANLWTYNGTYPAPTIKVEKGDLLRINFIDSLSDSSGNLQGHRRDGTNLHTHGLHVSPEGNSDNVMHYFVGGDTFTYEYDLSLHPGGNLNYYHPHAHGTTAEQVWSGMAGALEVADENTLLSGYETHTMVLKDISLDGNAPAAHTYDDYTSGKEGDIVTVNGQVNPVLNMRPGQVQRWKIVNASNARFYKLNLANHSLRVIGTDGGLLDKPYTMSSMLLSPGERIDILVKASTTKASYKLYSLPYDRGMSMMSGSGGSNQQVTLLTVNVTGSSVSNSIPSVINPAATRISVPQGTPTRQIVLSMGMMGGSEAYINGIAFSDTNAYTAYSSLGSYEIWEVVNQSMMDHPFHHHVNAAQVLSVSGGDSSYNSFYTSAPAWKDTVIVPKGGSVRLLIPIRDFTGMTMFHCHILEHEDIGMMGIWDIQ